MGQNGKADLGSSPARLDWRWLELARVLKGIAERHEAEILRRQEERRPAPVATQRMRRG